MIEVLKAAFVQGRLAKDEFDLRVSQMFASRTYADLTIVTADIPAGLTQAQPPEPARQSNDKKAPGPGRRIDAIVGLAVVAASIVVASSIHRPRLFYSCLRGPCPRLPPDYPVTLRVAIVAGGFVAAGLIVAIGSLYEPLRNRSRPNVLRARSSSKHWRSRSLRDSRSAS